ncbi:MAG: P-II family nitrogen regulator [Propionibacteriaceae bacterium]|jgi:nitrogen regulatory protein P-II 1|nr:P-II family nitrogen regulator [Propionibacteriaceae bacterium]
MKLITAIVQPEKLADVQIALAQHQVAGMTISECTGYARQHGHNEIYRGAEFTIDFVLKVKLEILCRDAAVDQIIDVIVQTARTGQVGDGKVWVTPVESAVRIRTGERDGAAV